MCIQYWPPSLEKTETYGDIHIGIVREEQLANFQIRTFRIWKECNVSTIDMYVKCTSIVHAVCIFHFLHLSLVFHFNLIKFKVGAFCMHLSYLNERYFFL